MQSKKALIVDSNPGGRELVRVLLEHEGYATMVARNAAEALALATSSAPDLITIDLQMKHQEGYVAARTLRKSGHFKKLILALTGRELDQDPTRIKAAGFSSFISKPILLKGLRSRLALLSAH